MGEAWRERAACRLPGAPDFYPVDDAGTEVAAAWCLSCPVQLECAEAGLREPFGVWGGLSERQRARIRKQRGIVLITEEAPCPMN